MSSTHQQGRFSYVFPEDRSEPQEHHRAIVIVRPSCRQYLATSDALEKSRGGDTIEAMAVAIIDAIKPIVVGWSGFNDASGKPRPFDPADIDDVLSVADLIDIRDNMLDECIADGLRQRRRLVAERNAKPAASEPASKP